ncbi:conjugative transfer signal peptidase TraF [Rhizobium sp. LCM 4573]|uniref:conjugative transfer signal peptidase TraF n=1 Tax=Rhizobium sp. LCM 4573 TaxID=1848291 RepID=UPI0009F34032|nr:conjugative transfer signal peptidase TraF [Rhizobium sp. LCM 4573]
MKARHVAVASWALAAGIGITAAFAYSAGYRVNLTHSAPSGLWRVVPVELAAIQRGELVEVCPPPARIVSLMSERGYLSSGDCSPGGVTTLLKPVAAVAGDRVTIRRGNPAEVNGEPLPNTTAEQGIPAWPDGTYPVQPGQVWLFSTYSPGSFDSRYFGPVPLVNVRGRASPVLTHGNPGDMTLRSKQQ